MINKCYFYIGAISIMFKNFRLSMKTLLSQVGRQEAAFAADLDGGRTRLVQVRFA